MDLRSIKNQAEQAYQRALPALGLVPGGGISLKCPSCGKSSWMRLPVRALHWFSSGVGFSCPTACEYFGELPTFSPEIEDACPEAMDSRGVMRDTTAYIEARINALPSDPQLKRRELELLLSLVISTFDGLMRGMLAIVHSNRPRLPFDIPGRGSLDVLPPSMSFQNLPGARQKLLPAGWDMEKSADWGALTILFQKRHAIPHQLGVADREYLTKTGDGTAELGKRVPLSAEEVVNGSKECQKLINTFFGLFLS